MDGAALLLLVTAVGFGWQPMPDGSERYEYIVQVDSELAATIADGQSIPVVGEVPEEIQPIGRVRVVIGEGDLPRERLVTRLKPAAEEPTIVRGQDAGGQYLYNQYNNAQPPAAQPLAAAPTTWNSGEATPASAPAPSGQALFDSAAQAWNQNVAAPATTAINNAGQNFGSAVAAPVQAGVDNAANQLRQTYGDMSQQAQATASQLGDRTKGLLDEVTRPLTQQPALTARDVRAQQQQQPAYSTPPGTVAGTAAAPVQNWNQANNTPPSTDPLRPGVAAAQPTGVQNWNDPNAGNTAATAPVSPPQFYNPIQNNNVAAPPQQPTMGQPQPTQPSLAQGESSWNTVDAPGVTGSSPQNMAGAPAAGSNAPTDDPWKYAADPRTGLPSTSATADAGSTAPFRGAGSTWPPAVAPPTSDPISTGGLASSPPNVATPAITRNSFAQSPDRPLDGLAGACSLPATGISTGMNPAPTITKSDIFPSGFPNQDSKAPSTTLAGIGQHPAAVPPAQTPATASAGDRDNGVIALVAWVMLFGSAFGNLYLFWSYLDVRQKYRSLVRKTARAVGSRFSAA